jgi:hypothetical protein
MSPRPEKTFARLTKTEKTCFEKKRKTFSVLPEKPIFFNGNHQEFRPKIRY